MRHPERPAPADASTGSSGGTIWARVMGPRLPMKPEAEDATAAAPGPI
jgi:hypothetical protein